MVAQVIIYPDVMQAAILHLRAQLALRAESYALGCTVGHTQPTPHPALPYVWLRRVGGFTTGRATDRARLDVHVYHENEFKAHALTQLVRGLLLAWPAIDSHVAKGADEFSGPGPVPDELWPEASRFYFTVEIVLRGLVA